jgi:formamidopyrimidine-DNA glycosylase
MPELAEVECVRRVLKENIINLKINDIEIKYDKIVENDNNYFIDSLKGQTYKDILRRGKYLIFVLDKGYIISHLRMEGKYFYVPKDSMDNKHIHLIYYLSNGYMLCYQDVRKFGRIEFKDDSKLYNTFPISDVGYDPILDKEIEINRIYDKILNKAIPIKTTLLDQNIIAGLGNIYVDEVLFKAKINPLRPSNEISLNDLENIIKYTKEILNEAIKNKGTTIRSYTSSLGVEGNYQNFLNVHTKTICPLCNNKLLKIKIGGRSTYYCNKCQE